VTISFNLAPGGSLGTATSAIKAAEAELRLLPRAARPLKDFSEVQLNVGTAEVLAHIAMLEDKTLAPGASQMVQLRLARPLGDLVKHAAHAQTLEYRRHVIVAAGGDAARQHQHFRGAEQPPEAFT
jgi:hypothetical protein